MCALYLIFALWARAEIIGDMDTIVMNLPTKMVQFFEICENLGQIDETVINISGEKLYNLLQKANPGDTLWSDTTENDRKVYIIAIHPRKVVRGIGRPFWFRMKVKDKKHNVDLVLPMFIFRFIGRIAKAESDEELVRFLDVICNIDRKFVFIKESSPERKVLFAFR